MTSFALNTMDSWPPMDSQTWTKLNCAIYDCSLLLNEFLEMPGVLLYRELETSEIPVPTFLCCLGTDPTKQIYLSI